MRRGTAHRLTLTALCAVAAAVWTGAPAGASDIARPLLIQSAPPVALAKGLPTRSAATAPGGIQLSLTQAYPIQGGTLLQETFQNGLPQAPGYAVTAWVEVTPPFAAPYRVARLPNGKGVLQRSRDRGRTWRTQRTAQVRATGSNVIFTLLRSDGATGEATVRAGWTAVKPDGSGATASAFPAVLGTLAGTGPWRLPAIGLVAGGAGGAGGGASAGASSGPAPGLCSAPAVPLGVGLGGVVVGPPGARWPAGAGVSVSAIPDLAGAFAPPYLSGEPAAGRFDLFPAGFGSPAKGSATLPPAGTGPLTVPVSTLFGQPLGLRADGAVSITVRLQQGGGVCERVSPALPLIAPGEGAAIDGPGLADPPPPSPDCDRAELQALVDRLRASLAAMVADLSVARTERAGLAAAEKAARANAKEFERLRNAGVLSPDDELRREGIELDRQIREVEERTAEFRQVVTRAEQRLAGCP